MKTVTVLMSTYNGEKYLVEQVESLIKQEDVELSILVRDDGSTDSTRDILNKYKNKKNLSWYSGENLRSARSFLNLIDNAPESDYYAFCDQDDVWYPEKLKKAVEKLESIIDNGHPKLYCSNYQLVDAELNNLPDNGHISTTTFGASLVASNCTGCTTVFDRRLLEMLRMDKPKVIVMHDDWVHKVCLAVGGTVVYDEERTLMYRQHGGNVDGGVHGLREKIIQIQKRMKSKDCIRSEQLKELMKIYQSLMSKRNSEMIGRVAYYRDQNILSRIRLANSNKIKTPYNRLNKGYKIAIILKYF